MGRGLAASGTAHRSRRRAARRAHRRRRRLSRRAAATRAASTHTTRAPTAGIGCPTCRCPSTMPPLRPGAGRVVVVGGYGEDRAPLRAAFVFDGNRWRGSHHRPRSGQRPLPRRRPTAVSGSSAAERGPASRTNALSLDLKTLRWRDGPRAATTRAPGGDGTRRTRLRPRRTPRRLRHQPRDGRGLRPGTNRWSKLPDLPDPRGGTGAAALAGRIVSVGGESPGGTNATVWTSVSRGRPVGARSRPPHAASRPRRRRAARAGVGDRRRPEAGSHRERRCRSRSRSLIVGSRLVVTKTARRRHTPVTDEGIAWNQGTGVPLGVVVVSGSCAEPSDGSVRDGRSHDAPEEPEPEGARDHEADDRQQVEPEQVRTVLGQHADQGRANEATEDRRARLRSG